MKLKTLTVSAVTILLVLTGASHSSPLKLDKGAIWHVHATGRATAWAYHSNYHATWLLTCGHAAWDKRMAINVHRGVGDLQAAKIVATTGPIGEDLAVIKVLSPNKPTLKFGRDGRQGDDVYGYGMPGGPPGLYAKGIISGMLAGAQVVSFQLGSGASGGPIVGADGNVCAMIRTVVNPRTLQEGNGVTKVSTIIRWLKARRLMPR